MKRQPNRRWAPLGLATAGLLAAYAAPAAAHHSFAMYDQTKTVTLTGVTYRFVAQANHAELHMYLIGPDGKLAKGPDGKNVAWGVELEAAAAAARQGITAAAFVPGTIFSIKVNPTRDGKNFGSRVGGSAIAKCPWKTPPTPGQTCAAVQGRELIGSRSF